MKIKFLEIESSVKSKLDQVFSALNQLRFRKEPILEFEDECIDEEEEENVSTQVLQKQKKSKYWFACRITWKYNATFFQSLASTAENTTLN